MSQTKAGPTHIRARIIIEGPAEEILAAMQHVRGGTRTVHLSVEVPQRHYLDRMHFLPEIREGKTQNAFEKLDMLSRQTIVDDETERRLDRLIRDFGDFTGR